MNDDSSVKVELSAAKQALLRARLQQRGSSGIQAIPRLGLTEATLSFAQQRLWFLDQFSPGAYAYNVPRLFRVNGKLDVSALQHALDSLVDRHEILRTVFKMTQAEPMQIVQPPRAVSLTLHDLRRLVDSERETRRDQIIADEVKRPFNLSSDLMLRATVVHSAE